MRAELPVRGMLGAVVCSLLAPAVLFCSLSAWGQQATLIGDAHVSSAQPTVNAGNLSNLDVGGVYTALIQFDLGVLPAGTTAAQITKATLRVFCNRADQPGTITVQTIGGPWTESGVTYATMPALGATVQTGQVIAAGLFVTFDVTSAVQAWVSSPATNFGLALTAPTVTGAVTTQLQFDSKENDETSHAPELDIALAAGGAGTVGATGATGPAGPQGSAGPQGVPGPAGATGPAGPQGPAGSGSGGGGIAYQGSYTPVTSYAVGDVVQWSGSTWISLVAQNAGNTPAYSSADWGLLAAEGIQGPAGAPGAAGAEGPSGPAGPAGPSGPPGATGASGPKGATGAAGAVGMTFMGAWNPGIYYASNDAVTYAGSTYLAQQAAGNEEPDVNPQFWTILAEAGAVGPTGAPGDAATVAIGTVSTLPAGAQATVTNSGTSQAAVLNFAIPQGAEGSGGGSGSAGGTSAGSSGSFAAMYHAVSDATMYYAVNSPNSSATETAGSVLAWVPQGCTATQLNVYSQQSGGITVTLRAGPAGALADTSLACSPATNGSCTATGSVEIPAGNFIDFEFTLASGTTAGVWTSLQCQ